MPLPPPCAHLELCNHLHNVRQKKKLQWQFLSKQHPGGKQGRFVPDKNQWESILPKFFTKEIISLCLWLYGKRGQIGFLACSLLVFIGPKGKKSAGDFSMLYRATDHKYWFFCPTNSRKGDFNPSHSNRSRHRRNRVFALQKSNYFLWKKIIIKAQAMSWT